MTSSAWRNKIGSLVALSVLTLVGLACSSDSSSDDDADDDDPSSSSGSSTTSGGTGTVSEADCNSRCEPHATRCNLPAGACAQICSDKLTPAALDCIDALSCSAGEDDLEACKKKGGSGSSSSSSSSSSSGSAACIEMLHTGCNSLNNPSNCCADDDHSMVSCFGNNDGQGHAQCCVQKGGKCTDVSECCGYGAGDDTVKALYKCQSGTCTTL